MSCQLFTKLEKEKAVVNLLIFQSFVVQFIRYKKDIKKKKLELSPFRVKSGKFLN